MQRGVFRRSIRAFISRKSFSPLSFRPFRFAVRHALHVVLTPLFAPNFPNRSSKSETPPGLVPFPSVACGTSFPDQLPFPPVVVRLPGDAMVSRFLFFSDFSAQKIDGDKKICYTFIRLYGSGLRRRRNGTDRYRSGHNGPDSKSGSPQGLVGSNPTRSARKRQVSRETCLFQ